MERLERVLATFSDEDQDLLLPVILEMLDA